MSVGMMDFFYDPLFPIATNVIKALWETFVKKEVVDTQLHAEIKKWKNNPEMPIGVELLEYIENAMKIDFSLITKISQSTYEKSECFGFITFVNTENFCGIEFEKRIDINDEKVRDIRKLLETTSEKYSLIVYDAKIIGIGNADQDNIKMKLVVEGGAKWTIYVSNDMASLKFNNGLFFLGTINDKSSEFIESYKRTFKIECTDVIKNLYKEAIKQDSGTLLVFINKAEEESIRLSDANRGMKIKKPEVNDISLIRGLTSIDGAVIFDQDGICYGIGYILDGRAIVEGRTDRGARYNSAYNYIANLKKEKGYAGIAVIVSEDKMIEIISTADENFIFLQ